MSFFNRRMLAATALLLLVAGTLFVLVLRLGAYSRLYNFDPRTAQSYPMAERAVAHMDVGLSDNRFNLPQLPRGIDSAFLTIDVNSTLRGRLFDPYVEFGYDGNVDRQYLARNSHGERHIDLSSLLSQADIDTVEQVDVVGYGIEINSGKTTLSVFDNADVEGESMLVLSPHPDDAELAAFGLYSGSKSTIVTITAGDAGTSYYKRLFAEKQDQDRVLGQMRTWDSITVPRIGGVLPADAINLGFFDGTLENMYKAPDEPVVSSRSGLTDISVFRQLNVAKLANSVTQPRWGNLVADLESIMRRVSPTTIVAPHPYIDAHSDHRFTTIALCEALTNTGLEGVSFFLYMNWGIYSRNFPNGPRTSLNSLPPWYDQPFPFASIYSHQLSDEESAMKAIALEAMRDFREFDMRPQIPVKTQIRGLLKSAWGRLIGIDERRKGYFRYASRPNEIFFVVSSNGMQEICSDFLARWNEGEFGHYQ